MRGVVLLLFAAVLSGCELQKLFALPEAITVQEVPAVVVPELPPEVKPEPPPPLSRSPAEIYRRQLIGEARRLWGLSAPVPVFAGQIHQESRWNPDARSPAGAQGLTQFMPKTAEWISRVYPDELRENAPFSPSWAIRALVLYDRWLWDRIAHTTNACDRIRFALAGYNGGAGWVIKRQKISPEPGNYEITSVINPGIHPANQRENQEYPRRITERWQPEYRQWGPTLCL